jgi:glycosyltransferase involved in cell wall biosynthesis/GT2 family glycosyltransferase
MIRPLRVTVVAGYGVLGGAELWLTTLLGATDRLRVDAVLLGDGPLRAEFDKLGIPVRVLPTGRRPADLARSAARLAGWLRTGPPDLGPPELVLGNGIKAALVAAPAARVAAVRCVWVKHDHSYDGRLTAALTRLVDGVLATSASLALATGCTDAVVVPPPRPAWPLPRDLARAALGGHGVEPTDERPVLAAVGRLVRYKGVEDAIRALALPGGEGWRLAVIGGPDPAEAGEPERLRRLATAADVADRVVFTGPVREVAGMLAGVDAVATLTKPTGSGPGREGFGIVALEAMAAGVPVVATAPSPVAERLAGAGLTVPAGDPAAVAAALRRLADRETRGRMGALGARLVAGHPDARECADMLARELCRIACRPGAGLRGGPPVSVVVTVLDEVAAVDPLLSRLTAQLAHPADEIVVVDGGSTDRTAERLAAWAARDRRVRLLIRPGAGISAGRNAAVRAAANRLVACTDAGCEPSPGWLAAFRAAAADLAADSDGAEVGLLTGVYRVADRPAAMQAALVAVGYPDPDELRRPSLLVRAYGRLFGRTFDATMPTGRSMAFGVPAWQEVGGFPDRLRTGEDVLFGRAIAGAGLPATLVADAEVAWAQRPSLAGAARMYLQYGQGSGRSVNRRLLGRDLARLAGYAGTGWVLLRGGRPARAALGAGWTAYLSLPLVRVLRQPRAAAAVPLAAAVRDVAKAAGALHGLSTRKPHT